MAKPSFFLVYQDDEGRITIERYLDESSAFKEALEIFERTKAKPLYMIRGETYKINFRTSVIVNESEVFRSVK